MEDDEIRINRHRSPCDWLLIRKAGYYTGTISLSVNGVVTACNQKTNREPVMNLSEADVQDQLDNLVEAFRG